MEYYHYTECGLNNIYLQNGFSYLKNNHGKTIRIEDINDLHNAISDYLIYEKHPLNGKEIRFLRHELGISFGELGNLIGKSNDAISRWERDKFKIDGSSERLLKLLYADIIFNNDKEYRNQQIILEELPIDITNENKKLIFKKTKFGWNYGDQP